MAVTMFWLVLLVMLIPPPDPDVTSSFFQTNQVLLPESAQVFGQRASSLAVQHKELAWMNRLWTSPWPALMEKGALLGSNQNLLCYSLWYLDCDRECTHSISAQSRVYTLRWCCDAEQQASLGIRISWCLWLFLMMCRATGTTLHRYYVM